MADYPIEIAGLQGRNGGTDDDVDRAAAAVRHALTPIPQAEADACRAAWLDREDGEDHDAALAERWAGIMTEAARVAHEAGTRGWAHPERVDGVIVSIG